MRTIDLYKFDELKENAKEIALNTAREYITNSNMYNDCLNDDVVVDGRSVYDGEITLKTILV